jgi:hypothetical protein
MHRVEIEDDRRCVRRLSARIVGCEERGKG